MKKTKQRMWAAALVCGASVAMLAGLPFTAFADDAGTLDVPYSYTNNGFTFEKVSHYNASTESADGIVDYTSPLQITANTDGNNDSADSVQSYTYCAVSYGDWVYMGTMYGALSAYTQAKSAVQKYGASEEVATAVVDALFNGKLNQGKESDGYPAGSVFFKFNIKTGETKILMDRTLYNLGQCDGVPIFRSACEYNGKLYFVGLVSDGKALAGQTIYGQQVPDDPALAINYEINVQTGIPCVYEVDPENGDELSKVTQCVTKLGYQALNNRYAFTSTRAINTFTATKADGTTEEWLLAGGLSDTTKGETYGATIMAAYQPSAVTADYDETDLDVLHGDFKEIADQTDLYNYPAITRTDASGGGGLYQIVQYGENTVYAAIVTGKASDGTKEQCYAIVKGVYDPAAGSVNDAAAWTWTPVVGNTADGAEYTFGIDPTRNAANACTLQVYDGYLYIGEYNDVNYSLTDILNNKSFRILAKNLTQSINLYRMDQEGNVELVVGDTTEMFPTSLTGIASGYESHMNQYTWMTTVVGDTMYLSTMDETSLTHCLASLVNGEMLNMSADEWKSQLNYYAVLLQLLKPADENASTAMSTMSLSDESAAALVENAIAAANAADSDAMTASSVTINGYTIGLTDEQKQELISKIKSGAIKIGEMSSESFQRTKAIIAQMKELAGMLDESVSQDFIDLYDQILAEIQEAVNADESINANLKAGLNMLFSFATSTNLGYLSTCLSYMSDSVAGFDLYAINQAEDGSVTVKTVSDNGFGDRYNHGLRVFAETDDYLAVGTANPFYGAQIWRMNIVEPAIVEQPTSVSASIGEDVTLSVATEGEVASYQWQHSKDGETWSNTYWCGYNTDTLNFKMLKLLDGRQWRCVVTFTDGTVLTSEAATSSLPAPDPAITCQLDDVWALAGDDVTFHVTTTGEVASYQWQHSKDGEKWNNTKWTGYDTDTLSFKMVSSLEGRQWRCVVTFADGQQMITNADMSAASTHLLTPATVTATPESASIGDEVTLTVDAVEGSIYQWHVSTDGENWTAAFWEGYNTDTMTFNMLKLLDGCQWRCAIVYPDGTMITSDAVTVSLPAPDPAITCQLDDVWALAGDQVTYHVTTTGNVVSYQWQHSTDGETWHNTKWTGYDTDTLTFNMLAALDGRQWRCVVTFDDGQTMITNSDMHAAATHLATAPTITMDPEDGIANVGQTVSLSVDAIENVTYQWQHSKDGEKWSNTFWTGFNTNTLTFGMISSLNDRQWRCKVTYPDGTSFYSDAVTTLLNTVEPL